MTEQSGREENPSATSLQKIALVGSYVPRQCGIATFTKDLRDAIENASDECRTLVLAMDDRAEGYRYPGEVQFQIRATQRKDYLTAADLLNINRVDIVIVQHEFGIYGGPNGSHVLQLMGNLRMPVITTLHTVLNEPSTGEAKVIHELAERSDRLVVMSHLAEQILKDGYDVPEEKVVFIPHGIPDVPFVDPAFYKDQFALEGKTVLLTFGLLSPGKGVEVTLEALPAIVKRHPHVAYVVLGATHPNIFKREGNAYRDSLERKAEKLGVRDHVVFHNRFVTLEELCGYIGAADVYVIPYLNRAQITSGTLAYAMGAGKAAVSTPFWYAEEMLADGRGRLVPFKDPDTLAEAVNALLEDELERNAMRKRAYMFARDMVWSKVGKQYLELAETVQQEKLHEPKPSFFLRPKPPEAEVMPEPSVSYLKTLTDDTGILQHAVGSIPNRHHGYCTDDNARALVTALMYYDLYKDDSVLSLINIYLSFLHHAFNAEYSRFRNFMSYDRRWLDGTGSEDSHGRALWGLGVATALVPRDGMLSFAARLFSKALVTAEAFTEPRPCAFTLIGIHAYLRRFDGDTNARRVRKLLATHLHRLFKENGSDDWPWCEDTVTYDNAKLPHALILSGQWIPDGEMMRQGLDALEWLVQQQMRDDGTLSLIGNQGWLTRDGERAHFDQQPLEAMALVEACAEAYRATQEDKWRDRTRQCLRWFLGNNDIQELIYDYQTGGCRDGLCPDGPNENEGAESTLAWLIALLTTNDITRSAVAGEAPGEKKVVSIEKPRLKKKTGS